VALLISLQLLYTHRRPMGSDSAKIPLPDFLKILTSNSVPVPKAMAIAGKVFVSDKHLSRKN